MAQFVQQKPQNEQIMNNILAENLNEVTESLGGLSNIIQLCLTNPNASRCIDNDKFHTFEAIMIKNGIFDEIKHDIHKVDSSEIEIIMYDNGNDAYETPTSPKVTDYDMFHCINRNKNERSIIAHINNLEEYYKSRLVINVKIKDNLCSSGLE